jgi:prepilin-type N-terminal cleavage/methylation domain-containing protein
MKKNGFTLVELIATIALMSLLATVILINMVGIKDNQDTDKATKFEKDVEEAACTYIDSTSQVTFRESCKNGQNGCSVFLATLTSDNVALIEPDRIDPKTNKKASEEGSLRVHVSWIKNGEYKSKKCELQR